MAKEHANPVEKNEVQQKARVSRRRKQPQQLISLEPMAEPLEVIRAQPGTSKESQTANLGDNRMPRAQRYQMAAQIGQAQGNRHLQRVVSTLAQRSGRPMNGMLIQRDLRGDVGGDWAAALTRLGLTYSGAGGVVDRQKDAVRHFTQFASAQQTPPMEEQIIIGAINMILGAVTGGVGTALKAVAASVLGPALRAVTRVTTGTAVEPAQATGAINASATSIIDGMTDAGKAKVRDAVTSAWGSGGGNQASVLLKFQETQLRALDIIAQEQMAVMLNNLGHLHATPGEEDEWRAANALNEAFRGSLDRAYNEQFNQITDTWFTMQVQTIGPGARPGNLRIALADRYPNRGSFSVTGGNLVGGGSVEEIRSRIAGRALKDIAMPKVIQMNGSMGHGILDCTWYIEVTGAELPSEAPAVSAPTSLTESLMAGPQQVTGMGGNRWGLPWLAAHHLGLSDLAGDDPRNSSDNQSEGARRVWDAIKDMTPGTVGNSSMS
jgi:hypothetical protein